MSIFILICIKSVFAAKWMILKMPEIFCDLRSVLLEKRHENAIDPPYDNLSEITFSIKEHVSRRPQITFTVKEHIPGGSQITFPIEEHVSGRPQITFAVEITVAITAKVSLSIEKHPAGRTCNTDCSFYP